MDKDLYVNRSLVLLIELTRGVFKWKKRLDVGKNLFPQTKAEINNWRWPALPSPWLKLTFLKISKKWLVAAAASESINVDVHLKLFEAASDPLVL
jgi:hypothetical protein